jgi:prephenate dehydrogenase
MDGTKDPGRLAVVGCGLVGGSIARGAQAAGYDVSVFDPDVDHHAVRAFGLRPSSSLADAVEGCPLVVLAVPLSAHHQVTAELASLLEPPVTVTDVASVKGPVADSAGLFTPGVHLVPGHPMSGHTRAGLTASDPELFDGAPWVVCPGAGTPRASVSRTVALAQALGASPVVEMSPADHDRAVAAVSHLVQATASSLAAVVADVESAHPGTVLLAGDGFRHATRVADSPLGWWPEVFEANREHLVPVVRALSGQLAVLADAVESGDRSVVADLFGRAHQARSTLDDPGPVCHQPF